MLRTADNVFSVVLDDNTKTALPGALAVVTDQNLPKGSICAVDAGMRHLDSAIAFGKVDRFRIVQGRGAGKSLMMSPMITRTSATISTSNHRLAVQQVSIVGFNGTTGALPAANSTDFYIKIRKNDNDAANRSQPMSLFAGPVKTDATASQEELAFALVKNGIANFKDEPANNYLAFDVISDGTEAAIGSATLAATNGSRALTYSAAHSLVVGDLVFIAGATYKVEAVPTTTTVTLSTPFEGTTVTALATGTAYATTHGKLTAATNFGVRMTGVQADFNVNSFRDYYVNRFTVTFSDVATLVTTTGARTGSGVWQQVAMDEYMSYGFEGENSMLGVPPRMRDQEVIEDGKYGCVEISWTENIQGLVSLQGGKGSVLFYVNLKPGGTLGATSTGAKLVAVLSKLPADVEQV